MVAYSITSKERYLYFIINVTRALDNDTRTVYPRVEKEHHTLLQCSGTELASDTLQRRLTTTSGPLQEQGKQPQPQQQ